jgi:transposase
MYVEEKKVFKKLLKKGFTTKVISEKIGVSVRTIERWRREARNGTLEHVKPARGRPLKASIRELRYLRREADKDGPKSAKELAAKVGLKVTAKTARRYLKRTGLDSFARPRVPSITDANKKNAWLGPGSILTSLKTFGRESSGRMKR